MPHAHQMLRLAAVLSLLFALSGCIALALGAVGGGAGYEAKQASEMEDLDADYAAGRISKEEYQARKEQIDEGSLFQ